MNIKISEDYYSMSDFLSSSPPNSHVKILDLKGSEFLVPPVLQLHCDDCGGMRNFKSTQYSHRLFNDTTNLFLTYICSNCNKIPKIYSLLVAKEAETIYKFGEYPPFGPPNPTKLMNLLGKERENFLKGRCCENQGLGVGAFTYYRRVVENQKDKIIGEIIKVSQKLNVGNVQLKKLNSALSENQFTNAINLAKDSLPESLLINGQNPLLLLYRALSEGVHNLSDEKCLELAQDIRIVLGALADRLSQALKDDAELINAISRLTKINS